MAGMNSRIESTRTMETHTGATATRTAGTHVGAASTRMTGTRAEVKATKRWRTGRYPTQVTARFPLSSHSSESIQRLFFFLYAREDIINIACRGHFHVEEGFIDVLKDEMNILTIGSFLHAKAKYEAKHGTAFTGIEIADGQITYCGFGEAHSPEEVTAYTALAGCINKFAIQAERTLPRKASRTQSDKYDVRTTLVKIGMSGDDYKEIRHTLLKHIPGSSSFPSQEKYESWKMKQAARRAAG